MCFGYSKIWYLGWDGRQLATMIDVSINEVYAYCEGNTVY